MTTRALVLGGGGITGAAWESGIVAGLAELGVGLAAADVIIGTSAGAVIGAGLACGTEPEQLYAVQLGRPSGELAQRLGLCWFGRIDCRIRVRLARPIPGESRQRYREHG